MEMTMPNQFKPNNTERDRGIVEALRAGERPREIAERLGISMGAVWQVKHKANKRGAGLARAYVIGDNNINVWAAAIERENQANDDSWDDDEPIGPVQRCQCGLMMPCHDCLSIEKYTRPVASAVWDNFPVEPYAHADADLMQGKTAKAIKAAI